MEGEEKIIAGKSRRNMITLVTFSGFSQGYPNRFHNITILHLKLHRPFINIYPRDIGRSPFHSDLNFIGQCYCLAQNAKYSFL